MSNLKVLRNWLVAGALLVLCVVDFAELAVARPLPPTRMPRDLSQVDFYLLTTDVGDDLAAKFGHTAVRIHDRVAGTDQVYNFGVFDFSDPMFGLNFFRGILRYQMADYPYVLALRSYQADEREVWEDFLNLTVDQKRLFIEKIIWQSQPENRSYDYQYFFDNCSTRVRDYLDIALGGAYKKFYEDKVSSETFRDTVRSHMATTSFIGMSLDILMNSRLERQMTEWEEMYLPLRFRDSLLKMPAVNAAGQLDPTMKLATLKQVVVEFPTTKPDKVNAYIWMTGLFLVPLLWAWLAALRARFFRPSTEVFNRACRVFGVVLFAWGFWAGVFGVLMAASWAWSAHLDLQHNANLMVFFPTDLILMLIGIKWMRRGYLESGPGGYWREPLKWYAQLHLISLVALCAAWIGGWITQDVKPILLSFGVISVLVYGFILMMQRTHRVS